MPCDSPVIALASTSISRATQKLKCTLQAVLNPALDGKPLDLSNVRLAVNDFGLDVVRALTSLFERISELRPASSYSNILQNTTQRLDTSRKSVDEYFTSPVTAQREARKSSEVALKTAVDMPVIEVPALQPHGSPTSFKATLEALQRDYTVLEYSSSLRNDLDAITAITTQSNHERRERVDCRGSWSILKQIQDRSADVDGDNWWK